VPPPRAKPLKKKSSEPPKATAVQIRARERGALMGLAVGESVGTYNRDKKLVGEPFPALNPAPISEPLGGGPHKLLRGQISLVSELSCCLSEVLRENQRYEFTQAARAYRTWSEGAVEVPDALKASLAIMAEGRPPQWVGRLSWLGSGQTLRDNCALSRCVPIGVYLSRFRDERILASFADASFTNFAPVCQLASAVFTGLIAAAIHAPSERLTPAEFLKAADEELTYVAAKFAQVQPDWAHLAKLAADALRDDLAAVRNPDPMLYGPELHLFATPTHVRVSFRLVLWEFLHAPNFEAAVLDVTNRGGQSSHIHAALAGALFGAVYGERPIPKLWVEMVQESTGPVNDRQWRKYHPQVLTSLVTPERLAAEGEEPSPFG
jgi:ADP-ribosylglycohydrolase